ncbi:hypothetical protein GIX45_02400 [Erwinia sp. CPCC 100877]|nr:hypothetical protein [Erwinia sp. CPCC 100877]
MRNRRHKIKVRVMLVLILLFLIVAGGYFLILQDKLQASTVVSTGAFRLKAENRWDGNSQKNYAFLEWDEVSGLSQAGYQLYQSEDGQTWNNRSLNYGKAIKVLNIYPNVEKSNTLKSWMDGLNLKASDGSNLIQVTPVSLTQYNANPDSYLKNSQGEYQHDVLMFGSWDSNNYADISQNGADATKAFLETGRGALFGHDTITNKRTVFFNTFKDFLGIKKQVSTDSMTGSTQVQLINNGYLMKYPFEMKNNVILTIPYSHNIDLQVKNVGTTWLEFINPSGSWPYPIYDNGSMRGGWYLKTNNNIGMIQTGHSNGASTVDERRIIANTLYNLAQVSFETNAQDQTVKDDQAPNLPSVTQKAGGAVNNFDITVDSIDRGKNYQWYIEANTKLAGIKKSDVVKETIISNIAGYFYTLDDSKTSNLNTIVEGYKDEFGRISSERYDIYVAPKGTTNQSDPSYDSSKDANLLTYDTKGTITGVNGLTDLNKYLHLVSVDRSNNVSEVKTIQIKDIMNQFRITEQYFDMDGTKIKADSYKDISKGGSYTESFKPIAGYVENSYSIDGNSSIEGDSETIVSVVNVNNHATITYYYNKLIQLNLRQIILSPSDELVIPKSGYFQLDNGKLNKKSNLFHATVQSGQESDNVSYTQLMIAKSGNHDQLSITPMIPEYYSYSGYVATTNNVLHASSAKIKSNIALNIKDQANYWLTIYLEPVVAGQESPVPYSWEYQDNHLGKIIKKIPN